jgi:hypothetical protein
MKSPPFLPALLAVVLAAGSARAATADLQPPKLRDATVSLAQKLLEPKPAAPLPVKLQDPFAMPAPPTADQTSATDPNTDLPGPPPPPPPPPEPADRQLLEAIAPLITPSGTAVFGGHSLLLFGQKKLRVGDTLPIIYKDKPFELTITAIEDGTFTLRLRAEEITRTIKPGPSNPSKP